MKDIEVKEVVISNLTLKGDGINKPFRRVLEVYEKDGTLIASNDPIQDDKQFTKTQMLNFATFAREVKEEVTIEQLFSMRPLKF